MRRYAQSMADHPTAEGLPITDRDPAGYVEPVQNAQPPKPAEFSLRIGSLKGQ